MALEAFSQDENPFETRTDLDEYDEAPDDGQELDESSSSEDSDDDQTQEADSVKIGDKVFFSGRAYAGLQDGRKPNAGEGPRS